MVRYPLLIVNVTALLVAGCSSNVCSPATCVGGCCNALGACVSPTPDECGRPGETCARCAAGQQCLVGVCSGGTAGGTGGTAGGTGTAGGSGMGGGSGGGSGTAGGFADDAGVPRCGMTAVPCQDESVMLLPLKMTVNPDGVVEEGTVPGDFISRIDARAGGSNPQDSFLYFSFGNQGLVKKAISDEQSLVSMDWDFALRRYVLRLNSGVSGPSCVEGARTAPGTDFATLTVTPPNLMWRTEEYFTPPTPPATMCTEVGHPSGLSVSTALSSWWTYMSCVQTTSNVYVVRTREGRYVKLQVLSYYRPADQITCNNTGVMGQDAAIVRMRWGFIAPPP